MSDVLEPRPLRQSELPPDRPGADDRTVRPVARVDAQLDPPFGTYRPGPLVHALLHAARRMPRVPGRVALAHLARSIALAVARPPLDVRCGSIRLRSDPTDNHCEKTFIFTPWRFDTAERRLLFENLPPDGVFVDVGANVGLYTLLAAEVLGTGGRVIAVEPNPSALGRLRDNLAATAAADPRAASERPSIEIVPLGIADSDIELDLHLVAGALGRSSLHRGGWSARVPDPPAGGEAGDQRLRIRCRPLLEVLREHGVRSVHSMKLDVEGAEDRALVPYLESATDDELPRTVSIENSSEAWALDVPAALERRGYAVVRRTHLNLVYRRTAGASARGPMHRRKPPPPSGS